MRRFSRPRHATLVAYLALFSGLGGTAFAAATITGADIVDGTIESVDVKNRSLAGGELAIGAVGNFELGAHSVTTNKVFDNGLTGVDIKDGSISAADLKPGAGMAEVKTVTEFSAYDSAQTKNVLAKCPSGWRTIGGGGATFSQYSDIPQVGLKSSMAHQFSIFPAIYGWRAVAAEHSPTSVDWHLMVEAYCVQLEG